MSHDDRRYLRSERPMQALTFLLHSHRTRGAFDALVISDDAGLLVAHAGAFNINAEEVAAVLPITTRRRGVEKLRTTKIDVDGQTLYLGAIGGNPNELKAEIDETLRGVQRILAA